jgi:ATP-dependent HslUV protease ATP-binding subunit HslU
MPLPIEDLTPRQIVQELNKYIVGQDAAKRAVAVALRKRYRRQQVEPAERDDILPKNILMIGPTGVGKTEIARRLAQLASAPFVKVEATKFTEVGYVGRDVESMVRDLVANAVRLVETERMQAVWAEAEQAAIERIVDELDDTPRGTWDPWNPDAQPEEPGPTEAERTATRARIREELLRGDHDRRTIEVDVEEPQSPFLQVFTPQGMEEMGLDMGGGGPFGGGSRRIRRSLSVRDAKPVLTEAEAKRRIDSTAVHREAVHRAEQTGIIFIDEIDKVAMKSGGGAGPDVSREGVQRDLLPVIEGSTVPSKFGPIRTDHILFIAAGAFHQSRPSDLIPELQGRLPIRVQLDTLTETDFGRILREPKNALTKQYQHLLRVEGVEVVFEEDALDALAHFATEVNKKTFDIGARRLHTLLERLLEQEMFDAPESGKGTVRVNRALVEERLGPAVKDATLYTNVL